MVDSHAHVTSYAFPGLQGRTVVVVGAASGGIGGATCDLLADSGARLLAVDKDRKRLARLMHRMAERGADAIPVAADVTTQAGLRLIESMLREVASSVTAMVNVVGGVTGSDWGHFLELTPEQWTRSLDVNLTHVFRTGQIVGRVLAGNGGGAIVNVSAMVALSGAPWWSPYGATRAGVLALTKSMAVELGPLGIRANAVVPGLVTTPRAHGGPPVPEQERATIPLGRRGTAREVAAAVAFLLSEWSTYVTGQMLLVDGGMSARTPFYDGEANIPTFLESDMVRQQMYAAFERVSHRRDGSPEEGA